MRGWVMALAAPGQPVDLSGVMYSPAEVVEEMVETTGQFFGSMLVCGRASLIYIIDV